MTIGKAMLLDIDGDWESRSVAIYHNKVDRPAASYPTVAKIRDHSLRPAAEVHPVNIDADFHLDIGPSHEAPDPTSSG